MIGWSHGHEKLCLVPVDSVLGDVHIGSSRPGQGGLKSIFYIHNNVLVIES